MATPPPSPKWMIAAWPGMGNVAVIAAGYLIQKLGLKSVDELKPSGHFDINAVEVRKGVIERPRLPRGMFFRAEKQTGKPDLTVFVGESQPAQGVFSYAHELLDKARELGVVRVVTFASMATPMHPSKDASVFGVTTSESLLDELRNLEIRVLDEGQIGGLNGVLLGAASQRDIPGLCLMGEIPFFAANMPNPKAAKAVLDAFSLLSGIEIDLEELAEHAARVDEALVKMLERMEQEREGREPGDEPGAESGAEGDTSAGGTGAASAERTPGEAKPLDPAAARRIEELFAAAHADRSRAMDLKRELDRLGVFSRYENRFLDLFKRAE